MTSQEARKEKNEGFFQAHVDGAGTTSPGVTAPAVPIEDLAEEDRPALRTGLLVLGTPESGQGVNHMHEPMPQR